MQRLEFPSGSQTALIAEDWSISFDDLHRLRELIHDEICRSVPAETKRILGCLRDDENSLLALLSITELFEFMPINPGLADAEITQLARGAGATAAILSSEFYDTKKHLFNATLPILINWDSIVDAARTRLATSEPDDPKTLNGNGRLILHTSGSTGKPKRVPISIPAMNVSAKNIALGHQLQSTDTALNALPTYHIGALVDVLLAPLSVGGSVSITNRRTPKDLAAALIETRPTWVQIVPTILRRMLEELEPSLLREAGKSLLFVRSVSAPVPPDLKTRSEALLDCPIVEMYGMTETAGQISTNERAQDPDKIGSVGKPGAVNVALFDGFGNPVTDGKTGEVCVSGPTVFQGYEGVPKSEVFFEDWFRTGDLGQFDPDGYLYLRGRLKEMINAGGEKISPFEIETAANLVPGVLEAAAYALPHPTLGEQVGLTIACHEDLDLTAVQDQLKRQLANFKCPRKITRVDQLPRLANAKVDRLLLKRNGERELEDRLKGQSPSFSKPTDIHSATIAQLWANILESRLPEADDDFFDMGGDSLSATNFLLDLSTALKFDVPPSQLFETPTFEALVAALLHPVKPQEEDRHPAVLFVKQKMAGWPGQVSLKSGLFRGIGTLKSNTPLFWSSQGEREILGMSQTLGRDRPLYFTRSLFEFPNRSEADFLELAERLTQEINEIYPVGEVMLGGYCGGGTVMHFVAEQLEKKGRDVQLFISLDYWPDRPTGFPVLHGMTRSRLYSARVKFCHYDLALPVLHPKGWKTFHIDSSHSWSTKSLEPHLGLIDCCLAVPNDTKVLNIPKTQAGQWTIAQRQQPPSATLKPTSFPRIFSKGEVRCVQIAVTNTSSETWPPTELSGLSIVVDFFNVDGYMRARSSGYATFNSPVVPGEEVLLTFDVTFPDKSLPLIAQFLLVNQGVKRFETKASGKRRRLILPNLFRK